MEERFVSLWKRMTGQTQEQAKDVEAYLRNLYAQPSRHYHTITHITDSLHQLQQLSEIPHMQHQLTENPHPQTLSEQDFDEITLALWFHDAIYDTLASNNEEESARLFEKLSESADPDMRARIVTMILATKTHIPSCGSLPEQLMLDLDLSILGKGEHEFDKYDHAIRLEYHWVPEDVYREKRAQVLTSFLKRDRIYYTDYFHNKYDSSARLNLQRAVFRLSASVQPDEKDGA